MMLALLSQLSACSYRVTGTMTYYMNEHKPIESLKQDNYDCSIMAKTLYAAERARTNSSFNHSTEAMQTLVMIDIMNLCFGNIPNEIDNERFKCLQARGWTPRVQFVNTNYLKSSDSFVTEYNYCKKQLSDDALLNSVANDMNYFEKFLEDDETIDVEKREKMDSFAMCLMQNGWFLITQEPWYVDSQKLENIIRFIPRGRWEIISQGDKIINYYDPSKAIKENDKIRFKIISIPKDSSDPRVAMQMTEIDCKDRMFRESQNRSLKDKKWQRIPQGSHGEVYYQKLCK